MSLKAKVYIENEKELFDLLKQGDRISFEKIYKYYWQELYNSAYKRLPEKEKCQDIIQNVFMSLWTRREEVDLENPRAYLHTAVRYQVFKQINRDPKGSFLSETFERELISPLTTDAEVLEKEVKNLISLYIAALPTKRRSIFLMHYFEGLSTAKIAIQLNVTQKTVQNQLTTASHALRLKLTQILLSVILVLWILYS